MIAFKTSLRIFMYQKFVPAVLVTALCVIFSYTAFAKKAPSYYQLTVYNFKTSNQEKLIDEYLQSALLPALKEMGTKTVGVFKPLSNDTAAIKQVYVLRTIKDLKQLERENQKLQKDQSFFTSAGNYWSASSKSPAYARMENIIIKAFDVAQKMTMPNLQSPKQEHIYELRSYEGASERLYNNKVEMFNEGGEVALFARLNFNAVFYGEVVAGSKMPNLVYMTSFENKEARDAHWNSFRDDPEWKKIAAMPKYQGNVSRSDIILMKAAPYSDF